MSVPFNVTILNELFDFGFKNGSSLFIRQLVDAGYAEFASQLSSEWGTDNEINLDEMAHMFNNFAANLGCTFLVFAAETFGNVAYFAFMRFEKYGGDPLKRSLTNQLMGQIICPIMTVSTVNSPIVLKRIWFGPTSSRLADLHLINGMTSRYWMTSIITEGFVVKALTLLSFKHMANINDDFMAKLLLRVNVMLSYGFTLTQFHLGYFEEIELHQTMVGKTIKTGIRGTDWFQYVQYALFLSVSGFSCLIIISKKAYEWYKHHKRIMKINIGNFGQETKDMTEKSNRGPDQTFSESKGKWLLNQKDVENQRVEDFQDNDTHAERSIELESIDDQIQIDEQNADNRRTPKHGEIVLEPLQLSDQNVPAQKIKFNNEKYNKPALGGFFLLMVWLSLMLFFVLIESDQFIYRFCFIVVNVLCIPMLALIFRRGYREYFITMIMDIFF